jgi:dihydrofolate reductase
LVLHLLDTMLTVSVDGPIAAGKSSVLQVLERILGACVVCEPVEEWEADGLLERFYNKDISAFEFQTHVLRSRVHKYKTTVQAWKDAHEGLPPALVLLDRWLAGDKIFAQVSRDTGAISDDEYEQYTKLYDELCEQYQYLNVRTIHLKTSPAVSLARISKRGRDAEKGITLDYLSRLDMVPEGVSATVVTDDLQLGEMVSAVASVVNQWRPSLVVARALDGTIGRDGKLPWHCPDDLRHFKRLTMGKIMVVGRKTFESMGSKALPGRETIVLSKNPDCGVTWEHFLHDRCLDNTYVFIGGDSIYKLALAHNMVGQIIETVMQETVHGGDAFFTPPTGFKVTRTVSYQEHCMNA